MLLFYLDEVGNSNLSTSSIAVHPYFVMGAMCINDTQRLSLFRNLSRLKDDFFPGWKGSKWEESEIKGSYLAQAILRRGQGKEPLRPSFYKALSGPTLEKLVTRLFNIIHRFNPRFYVVGINKDDLIKKSAGSVQPPVGLTYAYLQVRAALLVSEVYGNSEGAIFIADEERNHERLFVGGEISRVREEVLTTVHRRPDMGVILEKPIWVNRGELEVDREICQLIDFAVYIVGTAMRKGLWGEDWLQKLSPYLARHWTSGQVWDAGITIVPKPKRYPKFGA